MNMQQTDPRTYFLYGIITIFTLVSPHIFLAQKTIDPTQTRFSDLVENKQYNHILTTVECFQHPIIQHLLKYAAKTHNYSLLCNIGLVQSVTNGVHEEVEKFLQIGADPNKIISLGNFQWDSRWIVSDHQDLDTLKILEKYIKSVPETLTIPKKNRSTIKVPISPVSFSLDPQMTKIWLSRGNAARLVNLQLPNNPDYKDYFGDQPRKHYFKDSAGFIGGYPIHHIIRGSIFNKKAPHVLTNNIQVFLEYGAKMTQINSDKKTPLHLLAEHADYLQPFLASVSTANDQQLRTQLTNAVAMKDVDNHTPLYRLLISNREHRALAGLITTLANDYKADLFTLNDKKIPAIAEIFNPTVLEKIQHLINKEKITKLYNGQTIFHHIAKQWSIDLPFSINKLKKIYESLGLDTTQKDSLGNTYDYYLPKKKDQTKKKQKNRIKNQIRREQKNKQSETENPTTIVLETEDNKGTVSPEPENSTTRKKKRRAKKKPPIEKFLNISYRPHAVEKASENDGYHDHNALIDSLLKINKISYQTENNRGTTDTQMVTMGAVKQFNGHYAFKIFHHATDDTPHNSKENTIYHRGANSITTKEYPNNIHNILEQQKEHLEQLLNRQNPPFQKKNYEFWVTLENTKSPILKTGTMKEYNYTYTIENEDYGIVSIIDNKKEIFIPLKKNRTNS